MSVVEGAADERAVRGTSGPILGMVLFVASEAMFFAAFFGAYFTVKAANHVWPPRGIPVPKLGLPALATAILVSSSFVLQAGLRAIRRGDGKGLERWLGLTILLGLAFLVLQLRDYAHTGFSIHDGIYPSLFYVMTSLHMAHVFGGVLFLSLVLAQSRTGHLSMARRSCSVRRSVSRRRRRSAVTS